MATCANNLDYTSVGQSQLTGLAGAALQNANYSLLSISTYQSEPVRAYYARQLDPSLPFFDIEAGGCPLLHVPTPPAPPPAGSWPPPSPPGYCGDMADFNNVAAQQLVYLTGADRDNARISLQTVSLWLTDTIHTLIAPYVDYTRPHFILASGTCPQLISPSGPPPPPAAPPPPPAPPPAPAAGTDTFYGTGAAAITAAALDAANAANARYSLLSQDPTLSLDARHTYSLLVKPGLAFFTVDTAGAPVLNAAAAPTAPAPCPPGFVTQAPETTSVTTLEEMVGHQLVAIRATEAIEPAACKPEPSVSCIGAWVTVNDCMAVSVTKTQVTTGLVLSARILDCEGALHYMTYALDAVPVGGPFTLTLPLTPGFLLDVCVSQPGSTLAAGAVFVSIALQHTCAPGEALTSQLAAGYVTAKYAVSWPYMWTGTPYTSAAPLPGPGQVLLVQHKAGINNSGTTMTVTFDLTVTGGNTLIAVGFEQGGWAGATITDSQGNSWTRWVDFNIVDVWIATNAKAGPTTVTSDIHAGTPIPMQTHIYELAGVNPAHPVDVTATSSDAGTNTATTTSTSFPDVGFACLAAESAGGGSFTPPAGWSKYEDTTATGPRRLITMLNLTTSSPTAPWSVTTVLPSTTDDLILVCLRPS